MKPAANCSARSATRCRQRRDVARRDPEDIRGGVANRFLAPEPLRGWRAVQVGQQRPRLDFAQVIKQLVDVPDPAAERIVLVRDQRNPHAPASRSAAFPPTEAKRLSDKLEIHCTPKHGSWLNVAELELAILQRQCLVQRRPDQATMDRAVTAWATRRNAASTAIDGPFTTADARIELRRLYPAFEN